MEFLSTFWRAFWSPLAYKQALTWRWKILAYFSLLCLFSAVLMSVAMHPQYKNFLNHQVKVALADFQSFKIVDNKVDTSGNVYGYELPDGMKFLSVSEGQNPEDYMISIEGDKLNVASTILPLSDFMSSLNLQGDVLVDKAQAFKLIDTFIAIYYIFALPMLFVSTLLSNIFFVLILSIATYTMLINSTLKRSYASAIKISVLAITPMTLFQSISPFFSAQDSAGFIYGLISIILAWYMIKKLPSYYEE